MLIFCKALLALVLTVALSFPSGAFIRGGSGNVGPLFTPQWYSMLLGDGGQAQGVHAFPSGTVLGHVDTWGGFKYNGNTPTNIGAKTLPTPAWQPMFRNDNISGRTPVQFFADSFGNGIAELVEHPGNTNYFMAISGGATTNLARIWISPDRGEHWYATSKTPDFSPNTGSPRPEQHQWIAGDPNDATGNTWIINTPSQGAFRTTNATSLSSATFGAISGVTASNTGYGGSVFFDLATSGGSQKVWISSDGIGVYECNSTTSSCSFLNSASMPTRTGFLIGDKFGQLWSGTGITTTSLTISLYASGAWSSKSVTNINSNQFAVSIVFDPNTGGIVGNNQFCVVLGFGDMSCSLNNGGAFQGVGNSTFTAPGNQAAWLATATQTGAGIKQLNLASATIDTSGKVWSAGGISIWTVQLPIVSGVIQGSVSWAANSIGIEQLVASRVLEAPGNGPVTTTWDRALLYNPNPDAFSTVQYPQLADILVDSFSVDYALVAGSTAASSLLVVRAQGTSNNYDASSSDGGKTWTPWPTLPTGTGSSGLVAVSTALNWCVVPGNSSTARSAIYCTPNAGANWYLVTGFTGTPTFVPLNNRPDSTGLITIVAEKGSTGVFYAFDLNSSRFYKMTNGNTTTPSVTLVATLPLSINTNGKVKLLQAPGNNNDFYIVGYPNGGANMLKTSDGGLNWAVPAGASSKGFDNIAGIGFGAPKPGGSGYPTLYVAAQATGVPDMTVWYSVDAAATFDKINMPASQQSYPSGNMDYPTWVTGSPNYYGRVYYSTTGSGVPGVGDMADACPWVGITNISPNQSLSGTSVPITATHSGLVPVTGVNFYVNGVQVGSTQTGQSTYTVNLNATANAGSKILTVSATGANCSSYNQNYNSFSIPVTLSGLMPANDNSPIWLEKTA